MNKELTLKEIWENTVRAEKKRLHELDFQTQQRGKMLFQLEEIFQELGIDDIEQTS